MRLASALCHSKVKFKNYKSSPQSQERQLTLWCRTFWGSGKGSFLLHKKFRDFPITSFPYSLAKGILTTSFVAKINPSPSIIFQNDSLPRGYRSITNSFLCSFILMWNALFSQDFTGFFYPPHPTPTHLNK